jgi:hypothetical protein
MVVLWDALATAEMDMSVPWVGGYPISKQKHMVVMVIPPIKTPGDAIRVPYPGEGRGDPWPVLQILVRHSSAMFASEIH